MRNFFERQEIARKKTRQFIVLFSLAVIFSIFFVYIAVTVAYFIALMGIGPHMVSALEILLSTSNETIAEFWDFVRFTFVTGITLSFIIYGSYYKIVELREGGGSYIAEMLGGRPISRSDKNNDEVRLKNVVEEMAIASSVAVPDIYIMDMEKGINAFSVGNSMHDSVICVTKGTLDLLNRDELQGVIAHEFSHILNNDVVMNIRLMGWLHGLLLISLTGKALSPKMRRRNFFFFYPLIIAGWLMNILGCVGLFFAKLIKSALTRQREYLADASAVQFTRNPSGLSGALKKIGGLAGQSRIFHPRASEASHMYFGEGIGGSTTVLMATHPSLPDRIRRIDPLFDGVFKVIDRVVMQPHSTTPKPEDRLSKSKMKVNAPEVITGAAAMAILETIGAPMKEHAELAKNMISDLPDQVKTATQDALSACAVIYSLLLDKDKEIREKQLNILMVDETFAMAFEMEKLLDYIPKLSPRVRLPLVKLSTPALRGMSVDQYKRFKENSKKLVEADFKTSHFEHILQHVLFRQLDAYFFKTRGKVALIYSIRRMSKECACVLSHLAWLGHFDDKDAKAAFEHGKKLIIEAEIDLDFQKKSDFTIQDLNNSLNKLATTSPLIKKKMLAACLQCLIHDKNITIEEAEFFRAVSDALDCPVPPWLSHGKIE